MTGQKFCTIAKRKTLLSRGLHETVGKKSGKPNNTDRKKAPLRCAMKSKNLKIRDCALLIGFDTKGNCVYSDAVDISSYYDGEHVWDSGAKVKKMKLEKVMGYLFDAKGELFQQFESVFDVKTGSFKSGFARHADGTIHRG